MIAGITEVVYMYAEIDMLRQIKPCKGKISFLSCVMTSFSSTFAFLPSQYPDCKDKAEPFGPLEVFTLTPF